MTRTLVFICELRIYFDQTRDECGFVEFHCIYLGKVCFMMT